MRRVLLPVALLAVSLFLAACSQGAVKPNAVSYALSEVNDSNVSGTVTFEKLTDRHAVVVIEVEGLEAGNYPAHIRTGDSPDGAVYISLQPVDGSSGTSATVVSAPDTGGQSPYEHLIAFDGFVNVHAVGGSPVLATGETGPGGDDVQINP